MAEDVLADGKNCNLLPENADGFQWESAQCLAKAKAEQAKLSAQVERKKIIPATTQAVVPELRLNPDNTLRMPTSAEEHADALAEQKEQQKSANREFEELKQNWAKENAALYPELQGNADILPEFTLQNISEFIAQMDKNPRVKKALNGLSLENMKNFDANAPISLESLQQIFSSIPENQEIISVLNEEFDKFWEQKGIAPDSTPSLDEFFAMVYQTPKTSLAGKAILKTAKVEVSDTDSNNYIEEHKKLILRNAEKMIAPADDFLMVLQLSQGKNIDSFAPEDQQKIFSIVRGMTGETKNKTEMEEILQKKVDAVAKKSEKKPKYAQRMQSEIWESDSLFQLACADIAQDAAVKLKDNAGFAAVQKDSPVFHVVQRSDLMKWNGGNLGTAETIGRANVQNFVIDQVVRSTAMLSFLANTMGAWAAAGGNVGDFVNNMVENEYIWMSSAAMYLSFHGVINNGLEKLGDPNNKAALMMKESLNNEAYIKIFQHVEEIKMYQALDWTPETQQNINQFWKDESTAEKAENKGEDGEFGLKKKAEIETAQSRFLKGETVDGVAHENVAYAGGKTPSQKQMEENRKNRFVGFVAENLRSSLAGDSEKTRLAKAEEIVGRMTTENTNAFSNDNQAYREKVMKLMGGRLGEKYDLVANLDAMHLLALAGEEGTEVKNVVK